MPKTGKSKVLSRRDVLRLGVLGVGFAALGSACAPASPSTPAKPAESKPAAAKPAESKPAEAAKSQAAPAAAKAGPTGKVVIMVGAEPPSLDPLFSSSGATRTPVVENVVEGLLTVDKDMKLLPALAASWERIDQTRMRFKLQPNVKFHNGEKFTSEAVVASVKRLTDPNLKSQVLAYVDTLDRAEPVDELTVDVVTKGPDPILLRRMTFLAIMPPDFLSKTPDAASEKPVGTGPYRMVEWSKGQRVAMTAFDEYWGQQKPTIKDVEFQPRKEPGVRVTALKAGEAHLIDNVAPEDAATLPENQVKSGLATECMILRPNTKSGITADVRVRQAISHSIDRATIVKSIFADRYAEVPNGQFYASTSFGYDPALKDHAYDVEKARRLVTEAGAEGKTLSIIGPSNNRYLKDREVMEVLVAMIGKTGLKPELKLLESAEWLKAAFELENPPMDMWFSAAGNELQDPDRILSSYLRTGGRLSMFSNAEVDRLMEQQRAELDQNKRAQLLSQIAQKNLELVGLIPIAQLHQIYGISPKLKFEIIPSALLPVNRMQLVG